MQQHGNTKRIYQYKMKNKTEDLEVADKPAANENTELHLFPYKIIPEKTLMTPPPREGKE